MADSLLPDGSPLDSVMLVEMYYFAGQLMASSLIQGGQTPNVLQSWCYMVLSTESPLGPSSFTPDVTLCEETVPKNVSASLRNQLACSFSIFMFFAF